MRFIGSIIEKLQRHPKRIVFPEGTEPSVLRAADELKGAIAPSRYDFDRAKQEVIDRIPFPAFPYR